MTLPFENDTRIIVKKLAKRNLKADKSRNILIIITIALATCLIMTTTLYFFASQRKSLNDAAGRYQAIINEVDNRGPVLYIRGVASFHIMRNSYRVSSLHRL